jgi:alkanesulfonate monooxygenase SsuD/methylene tetrahydromethanopterin reductase-like flavin-dependent oxidoreductase (luciferase family)
MRAAVDRGLARSGRQRSDLRITAWLRVAITDDIERGRDDARIGLPFYASLRQYDSYFDALGLAADARRLQDLAESGAPPAEQVASISDAMVDELVIIGPPDDVAARIAAVLDVVDDVCITPPNGLPADRSRWTHDRAVR